MVTMAAEPLSRTFFSQSVRSPYERAIKSHGLGEAGQNSVAARWSVFSWRRHLPGLQPFFFLDGPCPAVPACQMRAAARAFSCEGQASEKYATLPEGLVRTGRQPPRR